MVIFEITFRVASSSARSPGPSDPSRLASATQTLMSLTSVVDSATNSAAVITASDRKVRATRRYGRGASAYSAHSTNAARLKPIINTTTQPMAPDSQLGNGIAHCGYAAAAGSV